MLAASIRKRRRYGNNNLNVPTRTKLYKNMSPDHINFPHEFSPIRAVLTAAAVCALAIVSYISSPGLNFARYAMSMQSAFLSYYILHCTFALMHHLQFNSLPPMLTAAAL